MTSKTNRPHWGERTLAIHAGEGIDPVTRASSPNLAMSVTFAPTEVAGFSALNRSGYEGFVYARTSNPTVKQLEDKLAALEQGEMALCFGSGMAASHALLAGRLSAGDHLVLSDTNYVGVAELVRDTLPRFGISVTPVDTSDLDQVAAAIRPETKMVWLETPANPIMRLADIAAVSGLAHKAGVRDVVVDFDLCLAGRHAAARSRGGFRRPRADQIYRRPRRCHGRGGDRAAGGTASPQHRGDGALRRRPVAVQRLADPQGCGNASPPHEGACGNRP